MALWRRALLVLCAAAPLVRAFDCAAVIPDPARPQLHVDLSPLFAAPVSIASEQSTPPSTTRTSVAIDLCNALPPVSGIDAQDQCMNGTQICMTVTNIKGGSERVEQVVPAAGQFAAGRTMDASSAGRTGAFTLSLQGESWAQTAQRTTVKFQCDPSQPSSAPTLEGYDAQAGELKLAWRTSHACARRGGGAAAAGARSFFRTLFWLVAIITLLYLGIGIWYNYNQYGASGWDLLPHRSFWSEVPYLAQDAFKHVIRSLSSSGTMRGGYEPV
ncbi:type II membrane protein [Malassezia sp. CBS 17886]|nr:type II membrane protein [Malassezia sp. CBS 17886]